MNADCCANVVDLVEVVFGRMRHAENTWAFSSDVDAKTSSRVAPSAHPKNPVVQSRQWPWHPF